MWKKSHTDCSQTFMDIKKNGNNTIVPLAQGCSEERINECIVQTLKTAPDTYCQTQK